MEAFFDDFFDAFLEAFFAALRAAIMKPLFDSSEQLIDHIREKTDTVFLAFSTGKDAIATWLAIREKFTKIIPFYYYIVPGLEFVEHSLAYYESVMGCRIHRLPNPNLYRMLTSCVFQAPENVSIILNSSLENFTKENCIDYLREDYGYPDTAWTAIGVRAVDSPIRMISIKKHGGCNEKNQTFFPIWDWKKSRLIEAIEASGVKLPVDYHLFGRSLDGIDRRFTEPIKKHFPKDYARLCEFFPLIEADLMRCKYERERNSA